MGQTWPDTYLVLCSLETCLTPESCEKKVSLLSENMTPSHCLILMKTMLMTFLHKLPEESCLLVRGCLMDLG